MEIPTSARWRPSAPEARPPRTITPHWPEYAIEAGGLAVFMISACLFGTLLGHPESPAARTLGTPAVMRAAMGAAMGLTALALVLSPWGKRSGAHFNPAVTLTFHRLGRITACDALCYVAAQFIGGLAGVLVAHAVLGDALAHPAVHYVVTMGVHGSAVAFGAELAISFGLMLAVLICSNRPALNRYTAFVSAALVALYITFEAPLSGMSMNPARTLASALPAGSWTALWIYFAAPTLGMLAAAECYRHVLAGPVLCAKLHHENAAPCIFRCGYPH